MRWNTLYSEDERYLEAILQNDAKVLRELYQNWRPGIHKHVQASGGNAQDADDVFQDAMVVLYRKIKAGKLKLSSRLSTYFYGIAKKVWMKERSRQRRNPTLREGVPQQRSDDDVIALLEKTERYRFYREKLGELGKDCRKVLELFIAGESMENIAEEMGYASSGYAKKRKFYCKQRLLKLIRRDRRFEEFNSQ